MVRKAETKAGKTDPQGNAPEPAKADSLTIVANGNESRDRLMAEVALSPVLLNAHLAGRFAKSTYGDLSLTELTGLLRERTDKVRAGDLSSVEDMLTAQAASLNGIFTEVARRAAANMGEYLGASETYFRLAFKAQAQCRATLETLAEIKNPRPVAFVKQANIANGPQQVNNAPSPGAESVARAEKTVNASNELLEAQHGERLDTRTAGAAEGLNRPLEALGAVNRTKDQGG